MAARTLNLILALWLFVSAFVWPRTTPSFTNAWVVGLLAAGVAVAGMTRPKVRFANTALSAWLVVAALVLPQRGPVARWNDLAVAVAMLVLSLVPGTLYRRTTTRAAA